MLKQIKKIFLLCLLTWRFDKHSLAQTTYLEHIFMVPEVFQPGSSTVQVYGYTPIVSWVRYPVWPHTSVSPSADSRRAVVSYWPKYVHEVLVNGLGGLSLPRKSVVRLNDRPEMTLDVYRGRKTIPQQQHPHGFLSFLWKLL